MHTTTSSIPLFVTGCVARVTNPKHRFFGQAVTITRDLNEHGFYEAFTAKGEVWFYPRESDLGTFTTKESSAMTIAELLGSKRCVFYFDPCAKKLVLVAENEPEKYEIEDEAQLALQSFRGYRPDNAENMAPILNAVLGYSPEEVERIIDSSIAAFMKSGGSK